MSFSITRTKTYTVVDIRKVVENFAADFSMIAQATGLRSPENVANVVYDLRIFAEFEYLNEIMVHLEDKNGVILRAARYEVNQSATGWGSDRPGNNLWPRTPDGSLHILATFTSEWWNKTDSEKQRFINDYGLHGSWPLGNRISITGLSSTAGQRYSSNGYGWERTNYSR